MIRAVVTVTAVATACAAFSQTAATPLSFEVASIKPVAPTLSGRYMVRMRADAGRLHYSAASLKAMIQEAYGVQAFQISGPDWMASARFDVEAKFPAGAARSQVPEMLQSMLAERFKLSIHRGTRDLSMYALVVGKNGPKMKETELDPEAPSGWMMNKGPGRVEGHKMTMASLAKTLSALLGRPVVDQTGLKGNYDLDLEYSPDEVQRMPADGVEGQVPSAGNPDPNGVSLLTAVQSQLGLKLDTTKGPVEQVVVDHIEKSPTDN